MKGISWQEDENRRLTGYGLRLRRRRVRVSVCPMGMTDREIAASSVRSPPPGEVALQLKVSAAEAANRRRETGV
jgi:hypothetical protein